MSTFEHFIPSVEHPWTPAVVRLVCVEILGQPPEVQDNLADCVREYLMTDADYYGLVEDSELVAVGALEVLNEKVRVIGYLAVQPEERGKGHGRRLLKELETVAKTAGATSIRTEPNTTAEGFFAHHGYRCQPVRGASTEEWLKNLA